MKLRSLFSTALLVASTFASAQSIPPSLVGVWASDGSAFNGQLLTSGQAMYLGSDGIGAILGAPPPIGVKIVVTFDSGRNVITYDLIERNKVIGRKQATYDQREKTINIGSSKPVLLKRRLDRFDESTRKALGL